MTEELFSAPVLGIRAVTTIYTEKGAASERENRACSALILKWEGETEYRAGQKIFRSDLTHPILLPKGSTYTWECLREGRFSVVEYDTDATSGEPVEFSLPTGETFRKILARMERERMAARAGAEIGNLRDLYELFHLLVTAREDYLPSDRVARLSPAVEYLSRHLAEPVANADLAAACGMSVVYFRKLFTAAYGVSPMRYLTALRCERAKEMLSSDYGSVAAVGEQLGFCDVYHFSKVFKAAVGLSPTAYARRAKETGDRPTA